MAAVVAYLNGGVEEMQDRLWCLCRLSMTNSLMRKAANDDNAWKALYHKKKSWNYKGKLMLESAQAFIEVEI
ncbi:F-box protein SKIP8 [Vitis vinifera]|uniref:F-box protein SKIP8 n=1 Tax=Vitis vinifera TaxID=29760 RepID=A0A438GA50_VITVI|nr:F-box protein SKIP8 [Vitis vinifera]